MPGRRSAAEPEHGRAGRAPLSQNNKRTSGEKVTIAPYRPATALYALSRLSMGWRGVFAARPGGEQVQGHRRPAARGPGGARPALAAGQQGEAVARALQVGAQLERLGELLARGGEVLGMEVDPAQRVAVRR